MTNRSDKGATEDAKFKKVVQHFLNTAPRLHKLEPPKSSSGNPKKKAPDK